MNILIDNIELPNKALTNLELIGAAKKLSIPEFRGVFLRDTLPRGKPRKIECGILNLDDSSGGGTHWVAWYKKDASIYYYFDSFGIQPPIELEKYLRSSRILYNTECIQPRDEVFCGHLCLYVLKRLSEGRDFQLVINSLW